VRQTCTHLGAWLISDLTPTRVAGVAAMRPAVYITMTNNTATQEFYV
jgi:hypothetical protein